MSIDRRDRTSTPLSATTQRVLDREWDLFDDWCSSWSLTPLPATADIVRRFLQELPAAVSTQALRVRAIRHRHVDAGVSLDLSGLSREPSILWTERGGLLSISEAIAQLPRYRFPVGLKGRRDAFVLLLASLGMTRHGIHALTPAEVAVTPTSITVAGMSVGWSTLPGVCPRCVVTRWLQVLGPALAGDRGQVRDALDVTRAAPDVHACDTPVSAGWERGDRVVVSLDTHGWVRPGVGLSTRTITALVTPHRHPTGCIELIPRPVSSYEGVAAVSVDDLYADQDGLDRKLAVALLRSQNALELAAGIQDDLNLLDASDQAKG